MQSVARFSVVSSFLAGSYVRAEGTVHDRTRRSDHQNVRRFARRGYGDHNAERVPVSSLSTATSWNAPKLSRIAPFLKEPDQAEANSVAPSRSATNVMRFLRTTANSSND